MSHHVALPQGMAAEALKEWLDKSRIKSGPLFRSIGRYSNVGDGLNDKAVNFIFKQRAELAGLDLSKYSAHSLRSGFITSAIVKGKSPYDIIQLTNHKSAQSVNTYFREASVQVNPAAYPGISPGTLYIKVSQKEIPVYKFKGRHFNKYKAADLENLLERVT